MEIHELSARTTLADTDVFAVDTGSVTNKVTLPNLRKGLGMDYKTYNSVTDLGFTSGADATTILAVYSAMPTNSMVIAPGGEFKASELPNIYGTVEMVKTSDVARAYIYFYGKDPAIRCDYRMGLGGTEYNNNNANAPTGDWHKVIVGTTKDALYSSNIAYTNTMGGANLDDILYTFSGRVSNVTNGPSGVNANGGLLAMSSGSWDTSKRVIQAFFPMDLAGIFVRSYNGTSWTAWKKSELSAI